MGPPPGGNREQVGQAGTMQGPAHSPHPPLVAPGDLELHASHWWGSSSGSLGPQATRCWGLQGGRIAGMKSLGQARGHQGAWGS